MNGMVGELLHESQYNTESAKPLLGTATPRDSPWGPDKSRSPPVQHISDFLRAIMWRKKGPPTSCPEEDSRDLGILLTHSIMNVKAFTNWEAGKI